MKKVALITSLLAISLLASCGGSTTKEDIKFSANTTITLDNARKEANITLDWTPTDHSIECSNFIFTLTSQSDIESAIDPGELGSRPLNLTITFKKALSKDDIGNLKFHYNDKTAKKEGDKKIEGIKVKFPTFPVYSISMVTDGTDIAEETIDTKDESYTGNITVTDGAKILDGEEKASLTHVKLKDGTDITEYCDYDPDDSYTEASLTIPTKYVKDDVEVTVALKNKTETGTVIWKNWDGSVLETDNYVPTGVSPKYDSATPTQPTDTHVHRFTGWYPVFHAVTKGDNIYTAVYDDVPITDAGAEFKLVIPKTNEKLVFSFVCDGDKKLTVDWGDATIDINKYSHTYKSSGIYNVSIYREDITNINVTDNTSKGYITEIKFKDKITSIKEDAFSSCLNLTSINISKNVTSIGSNAFDSCNALSKIVVVNDNSRYDSRDNCNAIIERATNTLIRGCNKTSIPNTVTAIGDSAFKNCSSISSVIVPDGIRTIGSYAFSCCTSLIAIALGNEPSLISIGSHAFDGCSKIFEFVIPDSLRIIDDSAFKNCSNLKIVSCFSTASLTTIGNSAFSGCTSLSTMDIPDSVTSVGSGAFENCNLTYTTCNNCKYLPSKNGNEYLILIEAIDRSATSITIHDSCKVIGGSAFADCYDLASITIPDSVTSIGDHAFYGCSSLLLIDIPNSVTSIDDSVFCDCYNLASITIPNSVTSIGDNAFYGCSSLLSIDIPKSVTSICGTAFNQCSSLENIVVSDDNKTYTSKNSDGNNCNAIITKDGKNLIVGCRKTIIPSGVTSIGDYAFFSCTNLASITIPDSVTSIGDHAFDYCRQLSIVSISDSSSLVTIGNYAFFTCAALTSITIPDSVTSIGDYAFASCRKLASITIPDSVTSIGDSAFKHCHQLSIVSISDSSSLVTIGDYAFANCSQLASITIPNSVTSIGGHAFEYCNQLSIVSISDSSSLVTIGDFAFLDCDYLTSITIPDSVTSIGDSAFEYCHQLSIVSISDSSSLVTIGNYAFSECTSLVTITIPNSLIFIGNFAFNHSSNLKIVDLTAFIELDTTKIPILGEYAFTYCAENLVFKVANEEMANIFINSGKGWPTDISVYTW